MSAFVRVPHSYVERCIRFGVDMVAWYASEQGARSRSASVSGYGVQTCWRRQGQAKIGEVAAALYYGLDPNVAVNWQVGRGGDGGADITALGVRCDVKTTLPDRNVIWPKKKNHLFLQKKFDVILAVTSDQIDFGACCIEGWISKRDFFEKKLIADGSPGQPRLDPGTWYLPRHELDDPRWLRRVFTTHEGTNRRHAAAWS